MGFKFAARTLLELGRELISSDEVAIYELVKNSIDAGSDGVQCIFNVVITNRHYQQALDGMKDKKSIDDVMGMIERNILSTAPQEEKEGFLELIRAAKDKSRSKFCDAIRLAYEKFNWIEVRDEGIGMSLIDLEEIYLTVGTRSRRKDNLQGAQYLGDKGVGRLSAMRLGSKLIITTTKKGERNFNSLEIDWTRFGHDVELSVGEIEVEPVLGERKANSTQHGTVIRIADLQADWTKDRLNELLTGPIARMIDPFVKGRANRLIRFEHNRERVLIPSIPDALLKAAHAICTAELRFEGEVPIFEGSINYTLRNAKRAVSQRGVEVYSVTQEEVAVRGKKGHAATAFVPIRPEALQELGPFKVEIYWFNRLVVKAIEGLTEKTAQTRDQIAKWAGGPMLYRYGFRVLPYGDPDDDWLELDKRAFGSGGFKLNRQQIIGRVNINSAHTALSEQTNREGLIESPPAAALRALLMWLLHTELRNLINDADDDELINRREATKVAHGFRDTEEKVRVSLAELRANAPATSKVQLDRIEKTVDLLTAQASEVVGKTEAIIKESDDEREKFVHLAGIGLMTEFIFHELDRSVVFALSELSDVRKEFPKNAALRSLEEQLKTLAKRISAFDALTGEKRQVKTSFDAKEVIDVVLEGHKNQFSRHGITIVFEKKSPMLVRGVRGMFIQIIENLIANSAYWLKQQSTYERDFKPRIEIAMSPSAKTLSVSDNGPGVAEDRKEIIFHPFVTSKPANRGRGLGLYISRELANYHGWTLRMDDMAPVTRTGRLNTFILDMAGEK